MKDVLIVSYFVDVELVGFPKNFKKEEEFEIVRKVQREVKGDGNRQLFNVERYVNDARLKENLEAPLENAYKIYYDDYLESVKNDNIWTYIEGIVKDHAL